MPASLAISATASRSTTTPPGLANTSIKMALVLDVRAFRKFSGLVASTKWQVQPSQLKLKPNWVIEPPYKLLEARNSSPGFKREKKAKNCAACPDEAHTAARPFSKLAILSSNTDIVGFVRREYIKPKVCKLNRSAA